MNKEITFKSTKNRVSIGNTVNFLGPKNSLQTQDLESEQGHLKRTTHAKGLYRLAKLHFDKSDLHTAENFFLETLGHWVLPQDIFYVFKVLGFLVRIASEKNDEEKLKKYIEQSERFLEDVPGLLPTLPSEYFYNIGIIKIYKGELIESRESFILAYKKAQEEQTQDVLAKSIYALASSYFQVKDYDTALKYLNKLNDIVGQLDKKYIFGTLHLLYGNIYSEVGDYCNAINHYKVAKKALQDKTCWNLFGHILMAEGIIYKKMGEFTKALFYFEFALSSINQSIFKKLANSLRNEIRDVNDSNVDLLLDRTNRIVYEKNLGAIDFKHRFVLLEILFLLAQNPSMYYDKEDLAKAIWKDEYNPLVHDKLIYTSVSRLRKLIEPKKQKRKYIIRGKDGYTFGKNIKVRFYNDSNPEKRPNYNVEISSPV